MSYKLNNKYWTNDFYDIAPNYIKTKIPIVIPSYNRYEDNYFLNYVRETTSEDNNWPIYVVVRKSQKKLYEKNYEDLPEVKFVAFKDEDINNIGKTRNKFITYFTSKFNSIFVLDDDLRLETKTMSCETVDGVKHYRYAVNKKKKNLVNIMAMWQLSHEYIMTQYNGCWSTYLPIGAFTFNPDYGDSKSYNVGGKAVCAVCIDLKKLKKHKLNYYSSTETGHEDVDLVIRAMDYELFPIAFKFLSFNAPINNKSVISNNLGYDNTRNRLELQNIKLYDMYKDTNKYISLNKRNNVNIKWNQYFKDINIKHKHGSIKKEVYDKLKKGI